jgi:arginyl-tRNA synthetase
MHAALEILGYPKARLEIQIVQQVNFIEGGKQVKMSKRAGRIVTLGELVNDVGVDVAKFFFLMRTQSAHLDFDLDLARQQTEENPVFYVQYAHARVASVFNHARERGQAIPTAWTEADLAPLTAPEELALIKTLLRFPSTVAGAARAYEPHRVAVYLYDLAAQLHAYHHLGTHAPAFRIVRPEEPALTRARLGLARAVGQVIANGLALLGIAAPESM